MIRVPESGIPDSASADVPTANPPGFPQSFSNDIGVLHGSGAGINGLTPDPTQRPTEAAAGVTSHVSPAVVEASPTHRRNRSVGPADSTQAPPSPAPLASGTSGPAFFAQMLSDQLRKVIEQQ